MTGAGDNATSNAAARTRRHRFGAITGGIFRWSLAVIATASLAVIAWSSFRSTRENEVQSCLAKIDTEVNAIVSIQSANDRSYKAPLKAAVDYDRRITACSK